MATQVLSRQKSLLLLLVYWKNKMNFELAQKIVKQFIYWLSLFHWGKNIKCIVLELKKFWSSKPFNKFQVLYIQKKDFIKTMSHYFKSVRERDLFHSIQHLSEKIRICLSRLKLVPFWMRVNKSTILLIVIKFVILFPHKAIVLNFVNVFKETLSCESQYFDSTLMFLNWSIQVSKIIL